ncbi:MAG: GntR family transcriptional regulator [Desulfosarcina sp.]|nr:GntR family transcriptional regulator [Desulfosarcina sp.]MBC2743423.1 GntR family transcriptional regulator [Desulfosarcina sp.]MBC2766333.1 GntR family transcriptional regulator [Desulfosarcina sp.]
MKAKSTNAETRQPLGVTAYEKIYQKIVSLDFEPGQRLEEKQLLERLGMGRTPIREALLRLVGENMVESQPGRGYIVRPITLQNTKAVFEMMKILETGVVSLAVRQNIAPFLIKMEKADAAVKSAIKDGNPLSLVEANHDFHQYFAQCSRNEYLVRGINQIRGEAKRLSYLSYANEVDPGKSLNDHYDSVIYEHDKIITCLRDKNEELLKETVLEHIKAFQRRIILFMSS